MKLLLVIIAASIFMIRSINDVIEFINKEKDGKVEGDEYRDYDPIE